MDGEGPYVIIVHGDGHETRTVVLLPGAEYTVGRSASADIVLDHSWVSERHALIRASDPPCIVDVGSRNATFVDGQRLTSGAERALASGTVISIGGFSLVVARGAVKPSGVMKRARRVELSAGSAESAPSSAEHGASDETAPIVRDRRMVELYAFARQIATSSASVLVMGETGAGKELMAQAIHRGSQRVRRPLVSLNCAALPENLVESELFGYERGAFSGAISGKRGLFEAAHGSTLFLDEIGELSLAVQAKLLRVLEAGEVPRLGAVRPVEVDVRIVAATNRDLAGHVRRGAFRADLFYRLNGITIVIPPLRERPDDIEAMAYRFAEKASATRDLRFTAEAMSALRTHEWAGNVRELKSVVERAVLVSGGGDIELRHLQLDVSVLGPAEDATPPVAAITEASDPDRFLPEELPTSVFRAELERRERRRTEEALARTGGNQKEAARLLGVSRRTLMKRMDRYGMHRPRKGARRSDGD